MKNWVIWLIAVTVLLVGGGVYLSSRGTSNNQSLPGEAVPEMGRDHVEDIFGIRYNSDPPTSGPHFPVWAKRGVYDRILSDGYLIHSLEHGYIVISYNCDKLPGGNLSVVNDAYAHEEPVSSATDSGTPLMHMKVGLEGEMTAFTPETAPPVEVELPESFKTDSCNGFVKLFERFVKDYGRVIIVPRPNMDALVALTAWGRIDKWGGDTGDGTGFSEPRITRFIQTFHNRGPERTIE